MKLSEEELRTERFRAIAFAKSVSFEKFVPSSYPNLDVYVRNAHFRQLANSCWDLETTKEIDEVYRLVHEMPWYYVCEYPEMSIAWLRRAFDWKLGHLPRENVTRIQGDQAADLATLDDRTRKVMLAKNDLDFALYCYAVGRFLSRVKAHPIELRNIIQHGIRSVVQLLAERRSAHLAPAADADFYRKPILTATSRVVTEAPSLQEASAERSGKYRASVQVHPGDGPLRYEP